MKELTNRQEIAKAMNFGKYPVIEIDVSKKTEYGFVGTKINIKSQRFELPVRATLTAYKDTKILTTSGENICVKAQYDYNDFINNLEYANAPTIEADQDILVVFTDREAGLVHKVVILHTGNYVDDFCMTPLKIEEYQVIE